MVYWHFALVVWTKFLIAFPRFSIPLADGKIGNKLKLFEVN